VVLLALEEGRLITFVGSSLPEISLVLVVGVALWFVLEAFSSFWVVEPRVDSAPFGCLWFLSAMSFPWGWPLEVPRRRALGCRLFRSSSLGKGLRRSNA
jgi:hypothetical protein